MLLIAGTSLASFARPWVGVMAYYLLALLGPQYIWWWVFGEERVSLAIAVATALGIGFRLLGGRLEFNYLKTPINLWLAFLWLFLVISYYNGAYVSAFESSGLTPEQKLEMVNNIFIFYFCGVLVVNRAGIVHYFSFVLVVATAYLIYWANVQYLTANWSQFSMGRLMGPTSIRGGSIYRDENDFAMLFVTGLPFLYYVGVESGRRWLRYLLWAMIPVGWHAIFLTGSRGGLLGLCVVTGFIVLRSRRKMLAIPLALLLVVCYQFQAGDTMKHRSEQISEYEGESSAEMRITAWNGGLKMIREHPFTGVGLGSFITALPHYEDTTPRVAHNTFIQYCAESGVGAGVCYVMIIVTFFRNAAGISRACRNRTAPDELSLWRTCNDASLTSFAGLIVCSVFLSLNTYEVFYFLVIMNNALRVITLTAPVCVPAEATAAPARLEPWAGSPGKVGEEHV